MKYLLTGRTVEGQIVATEETDLGWKARQIAQSWEGSELVVELLEWPLLHLRNDDTD